MKPVNERLLDAIKVMADQVSKNNTSGFDRTLRGTIVAVDEPTNKYEVRYENARITAQGYSEYNINDEVYVKISGGDISNAIIERKVGYSSEEAGYLDIEVPLTEEIQVYRKPIIPEGEPEDLFEITDTTFNENNRVEHGTTIYSFGNELPQSFNINKSGLLLKITAKFKTGDIKKWRGNYGLAFKLNEENLFDFDAYNHFIGNYYKFLDYTYQSFYLEIGENFVFPTDAVLFATKGSVVMDEGSSFAIDVSNITMQLVEKYDVADQNYALLVSLPEGGYINDGDGKNVETLMYKHGVYVPKERYTVNWQIKDILEQPQYSENNPWAFGKFPILGWQNENLNDNKIQLSNITIGETVARGRAVIDGIEVAVSDEFPVSRNLPESTVTIEQENFWNSQDGTFTESIAKVNSDEVNAESFWAYSFDDEEKYFINPAWYVESGNKKSFSLNSLIEELKKKVTLYIYFYEYIAGAYIEHSFKYEFQTNKNPAVDQVLRPAPVIKYQANGYLGNAAKTYSLSPYLSAINQDNYTKIVWTYKFKDYLYQKVANGADEDGNTIYKLQQVTESNGANKKMVQADFTYIWTWESTTDEDGNKHWVAPKKLNEEGVETTEYNCFDWNFVASDDYTKEQGYQPYSPGAAGMFRAFLYDTKDGILNFNLSTNYTEENAKENKFTFDVYEGDNKINNGYETEVTFLMDGNLGTNGTNYVLFVEPEWPTNDNTQYLTFGNAGKKTSSINFRAKVYDVTSGINVTDKAELEWTFFGAMDDNTPEKEEVQGESGTEPKVRQKSVQLVQFAKADNKKVYGVQVSAKISNITLFTYYTINYAPSGQSLLEQPTYYIQYANNQYNPIIENQNISVSKEIDDISNITFTYYTLEKKNDIYTLQAITNDSGYIEIVPKEENDKKNFLIIPKKDFAFKDVLFVQAQLPTNIRLNFVLYQNYYTNVLVNNWDGKTLQTDDGILSPVVIAGKKESNNTFSGVMMGEVQKNNTIKSGLFGYSGGTQTFGIDTSGDAYFKGEVKATSLILEPDAYTEGIATTDSVEKAINNNNKNYLSIEDAQSGYIRVNYPSPGGADPTKNDTNTGFLVDTRGLLTANNAVIKGTIFSNAGSVGGWHIKDNIITSKLTEEGEITTSGPIFYLASPTASRYSYYMLAKDSESNVTFGVKKSDGTLYAKNAEISGTITAGKFGGEDGWTITDAYYEDITDKAENSKGIYAKHDGYLTILKTPIADSDDRNGVFSIQDTKESDWYKKNKLTITNKGEIQCESLSIRANQNPALYNMVFSGGKLYNPIPLHHTSNGNDFVFAVQFPYLKDKEHSKEGKVEQAGSWVFVSGLHNAPDSEPNAEPHKAYGGVIGFKVDYIGNTYVKDGVIKTSDKNLKTDICPFDKVHDKFFDNLSPCSFKFKANNSNRTHFGFIAQEVVEATEKAGLTTQDVAATVFETEGQIWHLRYSEFISLNTWQIQKAKARISELEARVSQLESLLQANSN